ncbi:MAG: chromate transporter [Lentisphaerae bacterium]|jgi:chromate transporter|nr:chromate transporter [Lentisphaerota bacterium]
MIYLQLAYVFFKIGLFTIGGGMAMLPLIHEEMTAREWMTNDEFLDVLAISEMTPGPMVVNAATFVGYRISGIPGSLVATLSLILPSLLIVCLIGALWQRHRNDKVSLRILSIVRPVIAGMVLAAATKLLIASVFPLGGRGIEFLAGHTFDWRSVAIFVTVFIATWRFRANPLIALACGGAVGIVLMG